MKKIVISFITLMAALLILIGFCSCGTDREESTEKASSVSYEEYCTMENKGTPVISEGTSIKFITGASFNFN